jgi:hypothetical protein
MKMNTQSLFIGGCIAILATNAMANDKNTALPGVEQPAPIVSVPEAEPNEPPVDPKNFMIGNTQVRISGSITVDVGTFSPRNNR